MAAPAGGSVLDEPAALDPRPHRELRHELSLDTGQDLLVCLSDGEVRDDVVELAGVERKLRKRRLQGLGQRDERLLRLGPEVEEASKPRRFP